jgi:glycosyltransferase involved in cell wall biosynthesis
MRIAQLIDSLAIGGAEKLQVTFMRLALSRGMTPTLITFNACPDKHYYRELKAMGVKVIEIKGRNLFDPILLGALVRLLRDEKFDVLHTHLTYAIILGGVAGWLTSTPVAASIHNLSAYSWRFLEAVALTFFTKRRIAVGWTVAKSHRTMIDRYPIDVVQNPVETFPTLSEKQKVEIRTGIIEDSSRLLLITVGRLDEAKGYGDLLDAVDEVRRTHPQALLVIIGAGDFLPAITAKIKLLKLEDHVKLLGLRSDVPNLLAASDIYVSASHLEALPVSLLEAMAAGLPVVATDVGDVPLIVKPELGICVPARQPARIAAALKSLIENPAQRSQFGVMAREYVIQNHSPSGWFDQILDIYRQMTSDRQ